MYYLQVSLTLTLTQHPDNSRVEILYFGKMSAVTLWIFPLWWLENAVCTLNTLLAPRWSSPITACTLVVFLCIIIYSVFSMMHTHTYMALLQLAAVCGVVLMWLLLLWLSSFLWCRLHLRQRMKFKIRIFNDLFDDLARPSDVLGYYCFKKGEDGRSKWKKVELGTTHLSVVMPKMAVAVTSSINDFFGSGFLSPSTGILLNNNMEGFSLGKRFPFNRIEPRKWPLSATCPTIVVDSKGNFKLVTGAAGGTRMPPAVGQVSQWIQHLCTW